MDAGDVAKIVTDLRRRGTDHSEVEVKRARRGLPQDLWESLSSFANTGGGVVLLGIDEAGGFSVTGVEDPAAAEHAFASLCGEMEPPIRGAVSTVQFEGANVVVCGVPPTQRDRRPCHRRSLGPYLGSRIRVGDGNRRLTEYEVGLLLANQREPRDDLFVIPEASQADMEAHAVQAYLGRLRSTRPSVFGDRADDEILRMTNVLHESTPTLAGLLCFGRFPQQHFPQLNISVVRYPTTVAGEVGPRGERFLDSVTVDGSIPVMVRETVSALKRNMQRRSLVMGLYRREEWEYPEVALREALVNALVHRDLSVGARGMQVQVEMYPDRLVIRNAGGLYGPVAVDDLGLSGASSSRNRALLKILADTVDESGHAVCENVGSGIFTMRRALADAGVEPPEFRDNVSTFEVVLPNHTLLDQETLDWVSASGASDLNGPQLIAVGLARRGQLLNNRTFRIATGVADSREAGRLMRDLVERGLLVMTGTRGAASYGLPAGRRDHADVLVPVTDESAVRDALREGPRTRSDIEVTTGLSRNTVIYHLRRLRDRGLVEMVGSERSRTAVWRSATD